MSETNETIIPVSDGAIPKRDLGSININRKDGKGKVDLEAAIFKSDIDSIISKLNKNLEITGQHKDILIELINNPDIFLNKTADLIDQPSINGTKLAEFIKKVSNISELIRLETETRQTVTILRTETTKNDYLIQEKETELQMLADRIKKYVNNLNEYENILIALKKF